MIMVVYLLAGGVLSFLSSRFIFGGDSAEFSAIAHTWSIPHPPGYPLYSLLLNGITHLIPFGTVPWRAALLSVIPTVLTAYVLYKILARLGTRTWIALVVSFLYIFLYPVWEYALVPEVFALNSLLVTTITYSLLCYLSTPSNKHLFFASFLLGLSVSHHHIFVIFLPGWFVLIKGKVHAILRERNLLFSLFAWFIVGISFYLYAPIASHFNPPIQWEDSKTILGFWRLITRAMYGTFTAYGGSKGNILNQLYDIFSLFLLIFQDFRILGMIFILLGVFVIHKSKGVLAQFLGITSLAHIFFLFYTNFMLSSSFSIGMFERFLISFYAILILYLGLGFEYVYSKATLLIQEYSSKKSIHRVAKVCIALILLIYVSTIARTNYRSLSYIQKGRDFDRLGKDIINTAPPGSIFFAGNDNANFTTLYQVVEANYNTKSIFFQLNFMHQKYYFDQFKKNSKQLRFPPTMKNNKDLERFIVLNIKRGIYLEDPQPYGFWMPYGLLWKYYPSQKEAVSDLPNLVRNNTTLWERIYHIPELNTDTRNILHLQAIQDFYIESYSTYAKLLYYAKENAKAQKVMKQLLEKYRPSNSHAKLTLMNMVLQEKKCAEARDIAGEILSRSVDSLNDEFITPLVNYYAACDSNNAKLPLLKKKGENIKHKSLTPLERF